MDAVAFPPPPAPFLDDDFEFGDFTFASSPPSFEPQQPLLSPGVPHSQPQAPSLAAFDDDWGDFVASPLGSHPDPSPPPTPPTATAASAWEKPRGPLPLSLFGADEEEVDEEPAERPSTATAHDQPSAISFLGSPAASGRVTRADLKDLIANLYGSPALSATAAAAEPDPAAAEEVGFGDDGWEFKAASSSANVSQEEDGFGIGQVGGNLTHGNGIEGLPKPLGNDEDSWSLFTGFSEKLSNVGTIDHIETQEFREQSIKGLSYSQSNKEAILNVYKESEQADAVHCAHSPTESGQSSSDFFSNNEMNSSFETDENHSIKSTGDSILMDFYHRLREESFVVISQHLKDLKEAQKISVLSGQEGKATKIEEEIQEVYMKLQDAMVPEGFYMEEHPSRDVCIGELFKSTKEESFKDFEEEYHLSESISLALEGMSSAVELCRHSMSTLYILQLASKEERYDYVVAWHSILLSCAQELQHGAMVWAGSCRANVCDQVVSQGGQYFVALGEVYRVAQILSFSSQCFKPWVLSDPGMLSEMLTCLDKCNNAWTTGLDIALRRVSDTDRADASIAEALVKSIENINELEVPNLQKFLPNNEIACKISLVPTSVLQGMKVVTWNGDHYFVKIANFWANQISSDPPQLSRMPFAFMNNASKYGGLSDIVE